MGKNLTVVFGIVFLLLAYQNCGSRFFSAQTNLNSTGTADSSQDSNVRQIFNPAVLTGGSSSSMLGSLPQFYRPSIMKDDGSYKMWVTSGDRVRYFTSLDGVNWGDGQTVLFATDEWELDGGLFEGYRGGISDPVVIKNAVNGHKYTMFYTAGLAPNTQVHGGLGMAFSEDGVHWSKSTQNPIRKFVGGNCFARQALNINGRKYFYFQGGGDASQNIAPKLRVVEIFSDGSLGSDQILSLNSNAYPLAYDVHAQRCVFALDQFDSQGAPFNISIYTGSDCFQDMGVLAGSVGRNDSSKVYNFGAGLINRSSEGIIFDSTKAQLVLSSGDTWGNWKALFATLDLPFVSPIDNTPTNKTPIDNTPTVNSPETLGSSILLTSVTSNSILAGWPVERVIDNSDTTAYSSQSQPSITNDAGVFVAAWFTNPQSIQKVILQARMNQEKPLSFPKKYQIFITSLDNSSWVNQGTFTAQPDATGLVAITLVNRSTTFGVLVRPIEFGQDDYGSFYFQLAELRAQ